MIKKTKWYKKFVKHFLSIGVPDEETLERWFSLIPEESRKILEDEWNLHGKGCFHIYTYLDVVYCAKEYLRFKSAEKDLAKRAAKVDIFSDTEEMKERYQISAWHDLVSLGEFAQEITGQEIPQSQSIIGVKLLMEIDNLEEIQRDLIYCYLGIEESYKEPYKSFYWFCEKNNISFAEAVAIREKAIANLREEMCLFYIPMEEERKEKIFQINMRDLKKISIDDLDIRRFSTKTHNALKNAGYKTADELYGMAETDFMKIKGIGKKGAEIILRIMKSITYN